MLKPLRTLRIQLLLSHVALVILMSLATLSAIVSLRGVQQTFSPARIGNNRAARGAEFIDAALVEQRTTLWLLMSGSEHEAQLTSDAGWKEFNHGLSLVESPGVAESVAGLAVQLSVNAAAYRKLSDSLLAANQLTLQPTTGYAVQHVLEPKIAELRALDSQLESEAGLAATAESDEAKQATDSIIRRSAWVTVIGIFIALGFGDRLVKAAVFPLQALAARAGKISDGDLSPQAPLDRHDEIGALSRAIEQMTDSIRDARQMAMKRLQRAEQMSDAALEHLYDPVVVLDPKARIVHLNQAADELLGRIPEGEKVPIAEHIQDKRLARALSVAAGSGSVSASEDESSSIVLPFKGESKVFRLRTTPMKSDDGLALGSVAVLEDVTHFRAIDQLKNEFIGVASHELRTPVSSLLLSAQLLKDGAVGELTEGQREVVEMQLQDLDRLEKLMRDLLDVTKLAAGMVPIHSERFKVRELLESTVSTLRSGAKKQRVELTVELSDDPGEVRADRSQIGRVLTNLTVNAIRHTPENGRVKLSASRADNEVTFFVEDTGVGIPAEYRDRIFDRFVQVPGATQGGAGLGLSIAQNIVKAHLGSMGVESEVGKGSVFHFTLPVNADSLGRDLTA